MLSLDTRLPSTGIPASRNLIACTTVKVGFYGMSHGLLPGDRDHSP
ncbi:hypothetical protein RHCRD62_20544 [Rhodococcus sp. RD6.2]|nr:hypothetical protein RHCRD62_20544 [Rhodococcus sp. RD6.2]